MDFSILRKITPTRIHRIKNPEFGLEFVEKSRFEIKKENSIAKNNKNRN